MALRLDYQNSSYLIVNIYAPTKLRDKRLFYKSLSPWLNKVKKVDELIICGCDWNTPQTSSVDTRGVSQKPKPLQSFRKFIQANKLIDVWRKTYPHKKQFTWRQASLGIYSRLDYWLISSSLYDLVCSTDIRPALKCDHNAVSLKLKVSSLARGKGYWKMNNALLNDETFKYYIQNLIKKVKLEYSNEKPQLRWEICKIKVRELAIKYSKQKQNFQNQRVKQLQKELSELSEMVDKNAVSEDIHKMEKVKKELDKIYTYKCKGAYVIRLVTVNNAGIILYLHACGTSHWRCQGIICHNTTSILMITSTITRRRPEIGLCSISHLRIIRSWIFIRETCRGDFLESYNIIVH